MIKHKHVIYFSGVVIAMISLSACTNSQNALNQQYEFQDRAQQEQCVDHMQSLQQTTVPLYYDQNGDPVFRAPPAIETFHCSILPAPGPSIRELNEQIP